MFGIPTGRTTSAADVPILAAERCRREFIRNAIERYWPIVFAAPLQLVLRAPNRSIG
jgi:hypothetical protein